MASILYPGEDLGLWAVLRGFLIIISLFGIIGSLVTLSVLKLLNWFIVLMLLLPYTNLKFKENYGFGITRWLKVIILLFLLSFAIADT